MLPFREAGAAPPAVPGPPKARDLASWILTHPDNLKDEEKGKLAQARERCPQLDALAGHVAEFAKILTGRHGGHLDDWIATAEADDQPDLHSFVRGTKHDYDAVLNGLTMAWNSGVVEGNVNRTIMWNQNCQSALRDFTRRVREFLDEKAVRGCGGPGRGLSVKKYILFDHDGVLVDTEFWYYKAGERALADVGLALDKDQYLRDMNRGLGTWAQARAAGIDEQTIGRQREARDDYYQEYLRTEAIEIEGVIEVLAELSQHARMAIVTTAKRADFELIYEKRHIRQFMDFVLVREDYERAKPHPEPYLA